MSNGIIKRVTTNYNLRIPIFDGPGWGREVERNFDVIDAVMFAFSGFGVGGAWTNSTSYEPNDRVIDDTDGSVWLCLVSHVSASSGTFADDRAANPTYWKAVSNFVQSTGPWQASFAYRTNDYMYDDHRYGIALRNFTSTTSYDDDVFDGNILTLIDLRTDLSSAQSSAGSASGAALQALDAQNDAENARDTAVNARNEAVQAANNLTMMYSDFAGGTSGQVLAKSSGADYDFQWIAVPGGGDMLQVIYDPNGIGDDVYDRANHTGSQDISTVSGLQGALNAKADANALAATPVVPKPTGLSSATDLDTIVTPGWHDDLILGTSPNGWGSADYGYLLVLVYTSSITQLVFPYYGGKMRYRDRFEGTWSPWKTMAVHGDYLEKTQNLNDLSNKATARTNLGATSVGNAIFTAASGANAWSAMGAAGSIASSGYEQLPSGLIIQWGSYTPGAGVSDFSVTYPTSFPNQAFCVVATPSTYPSSGVTYTTVISSFNAAGFSAWNRYNDNTLGVGPSDELPIYFVAIGY